MNQVYETNTVPQLGDVRDAMLGLAADAGVDSSESVSAAERHPIRPLASRPTP